VNAPSYGTRAMGGGNRFSARPAGLASARRSLYTLSASLQGFTLAAYVYAHAGGGFGYSVLIDSVHVPGSPGRQIKSLKEAARRAKGQFARWASEILKRV
jgi:hypothetical protein